MQVSNNYSMSSSIASAATTSSQAASTASDVDSSQFMELLMTQLTHQNPLQPMNDSEMMSQMAQLNSLQQLQSIKNYMQEMVTANMTSYAASLIGKEVRSEIDGNTISGTVTGITMDAGKVNVHIDDQIVPLDSLVEITQATTQVQETANEQ